MKSSLESIFNDTIDVEQQGKSIKITFTNAKKSYKYYSNGTVKEVMKPTSVYGKIEGNILKLRATNLDKYNEFSNGNSIKPNWNDDETASKELVEYIDIEEPISPTAIMFTNFSNLKSIQNIENLHTENMNSFMSMFQGCTSLIELNLNSFDTCSVTNMSNMFQSDRSLTSIKLNNFDTSNVTNMFHMFYYCDKLTDLDLKNFNTRNVNNMEKMFCYCSRLNNLNLGNNFIINNIENATGLFDYANSSIRIKTIEDTKEKIKKIRTSYTDSNFE